MKSNIQRLALVSLVLLGAMGTTTAAHADVGINKGFNPISVSVGQKSTLTISLINTSSSAATAVSLTDSLPSGLTVATPPNTTTSCGGTVTATARGTTAALSGGTIPAATSTNPGTCSFSVDVVAAASSSYVNTIPANAVTSSQGTNLQSTQATLTVVALAPVAGSKAFSPTTIHGNDTAPSRLTITLPNSNGIALTGVALTDTLPAQLAVAATPNLTTTCVPGTTSSTASSVSISGATIPANGSCTFSVDVVAASPNAVFNTNVTNSIAANALTSDQGVSNTAFSASVRVQTGAQVTKAFSPATILSGAQSTLTITFGNLNVSTLTPINFTDTFPLAPYIMTAVPGTAATTCTGGTASIGSGNASVSISGGSLAGVASGAGNTSVTCTLTVKVTGTNSTAGPLADSNTFPAGNFGGVNYPANNATLTINPLSNITASKAFTGNVVQGNTLNLTITLTNASATPAAITSVTDLLTTMGAGFTVAAASTTTCVGTTVTAPVAGTSITAAGGVIPASGSCTIVVPVLIGPTAATGNHTNTIATGGIVTDQGTNTSPITASVSVAAALSVSKSFSPTTVFAGQDSLLTITVTRAANAVAISGIAFTDNLPAGHTVSATLPATTTCTGGTVTAATGATSVSLSGASLAVGPAGAATSCTVTLRVTTPTGSAGTATNTIPAGAVTTTEGFTNAAASATLTRVTTFLSLSKGFSPNLVAINGVSQMTVQILNNNPGAIALTNVGLIDALPLGMVIAPTPAASFSGGGCSGATLTAVAGGTTLQLANANVGIGSVCLLNVNVVATAAGNLINSLPANILTSNQGITNILPVSATLAATGSADLSISKDDHVTQVNAGGTTTYTIIATNNGPNDVAGANVIDTPPAGMTFTSWTCTPSAGSACPASGNGAINALVSLLKNGTATFTVNAAIASNLTGSIANTATIAVPGTVVDNTPANNQSTDTDTLVVSADLAVTKTATPTSTYLPNGPLNYQIIVTNNGPSDLIGVTVTDTVPATVTVSSWTCSASSAGADCDNIAAGTGASGAGNSIVLNNVTLAAGASIQIDVTGIVALATTGNIVNTVNVTPPAGTTCTTPPCTRSATVTNTNGGAQRLSIMKSASPTSFAVGQTGTYSILVGNVGTSSTAGAISVIDPMPSGITITATPNGINWNCAASTTTQVNCTYALVLLPGSNAGSITVPVSIGVGTASPATNTATVSGGGDPCTGDTHCQSTINTPVNAPHLTVQKSLPGNLTVGVQNTYTIIVSNTGQAPALAGTITDTLDANLVIGTLTGGCTNSGQTVTCPLAAGLAVGNSVSFSIPVTPTAAASGQSIANTAALTGGGDPSCPGGPNCTSTINNTVTAPQLKIVKTASPSTFVINQPAIYSLQLTNIGTAATTSVATVIDQIPAGLTIGTLPAACTNMLQQVTCTQPAPLATNAPVTFAIPVTPQASLSGQSLTNTAITTGGGDPGCPNGATAGTLPANCVSTIMTTVSAPQLSIQKTASAASFVINQPASYTLQVTNTGTAATTAAATISDNIPNDLTIGTLPAGCTSAGQSVSCTIAPGLATGTPVSFVIPVTPTAAASGTMLMNTATVTGGGDPTCPAQTRCTSSVTTPVDAPQLTIVKTASAANFVVGVAGSYTLQVTNTGTAATTDITTITDNIPGNLTIGTMPSGCAVAGQIVTCTIASGLATGSPISFVIPVTPTAAASGTTLTNTADATGGGDPTCPGPTRCTSTVSTPVDAPQLSIQKTASGSFFVVGVPASYTLQVTNTGTAATTDVTTVTDNIPSNLTIGTLTGTCSAIGQQVTCTIPAGLATGSPVSFVIPVTPTAAASGTTLTNIANVTGGGDPTCPGAATCTSTVNTPVDAPQLTIQKTASAPNFVVGVPAIYTLTVTNTGSAATTDITTITDNIPSDLTIGTVSAGCTTSGQQVTCTIAAGFATGSPASFTIQVTPTDSADGTTILNTATVAGGGDPTCPGATRCSSSVSTPVDAPQLTIQKTASTSNFVVGVAASYTLQVINTGTAATTQVATVTDNIPSGLTLGTLPPECSNAGQQISCTIAAGLATGTPVTFTIPVTPNAAANGTTLVNTATVSGGGDPTCPAASHCTSTVSTPTNAVQLSIVKTANTTNFVVGVPATYTLQVTNTGSAATTSIATVTDNVPSDLQINGPVAGCNVTGQQVSCTIAAGLASGAPVSFTIAVTPLASADGKTLENTATVSGGGDVGCPQATRCSSTVDTPVDAPQLSIQKTASSSAFTINVPASYTLQVTNVGTAATTAIATVTDNVPGNLVIGTLPAACSAIGQQITCTIAAGLATGSPVSFTIPVTPTAAASASTLVNTATVSGGGDTTCPAAAHCSGTVITPVGAPQLTLVKSASTPTFVVGTPATYTLQVTNTGAAATTDVATISDSIPSNLTIGTLPSGCTSSGQLVSCVVPLGLAPGGSVSFIIPVTPTAAASGTTLVNIASVGGGGDPTCPNASRCSSTVDTPVGAPQLTLVKTASASSFVVGVLASYTLQVTNTGAAATTAAATITDNVPSNLTIGTLPSGCTGSGQQVTCTIASGLAANATLSFIVPVTPTNAADGTALVNTATVSGGGDPTCPSAAHCTSTVTTPVGAPQLTIVKTASTAQFAVGVAASYTLQVTNSGAATTTSVASVVDNIPADLTIGTLPASCTANGQQITCTIPSGFAVGATTSFIIPVTPTAAASGTTLVNTASVSGGGDPTCPGAANCSSTVVVPVASPQIQIVKTGPATATAGGTIAYTITVTNAGASIASNVTLSDTPPAGLTFVSASAPCAGGFPCNLGTLNAGQSVTLSAVTFTIGANVTGTIINTAVVTSDQTTQTSSSASTVIRGGTSATVPVPANAVWTLLGLLVLLMGIGAHRTRRMGISTQRKG
ncbi:MAG: hypothetical protein ABJB01_11505 [Rudaea sp.]